MLTNFSWQQQKQPNFFLCCFLRQTLNSIVMLPILHLQIVTNTRFKWIIKRRRTNLKPTTSEFHVFHYIFHGHNSYLNLNNFKLYKYKTFLIILHNFSFSDKTEQLLHKQKFKQFIIYIHHKLKFILLNCIIFVIYTPLSLPLPNFHIFTLHISSPTIDTAHSSSGLFGTNREPDH